MSGHSHYCDVIMATRASQITSITIVYSTVYSDADQRKHQSSASLPFVREIHRGPVNSPHKWPVTRKMSPFDDVIMLYIDMEWVATVTADFIWKVCAFVFPQSFHLQCKEELFIFEANETPPTCCPGKESVYLNQMFIVCEICKFRGRVKTIT